MVSAFGGVRHFTYLYEAPTSAPGSIELENWVGVADKFQVTGYPVDWFYENDATEKPKGYPSATF